MDTKSRFFSDLHHLSSMQSSLSDLAICEIAKQRFSRIHLTLSRVSILPECSLHWHQARTPLVDWALVAIVVFRMTRSGRQLNLQWFPWTRWGVRTGCAERVLIGNMCCLRLEIRFMRKRRRGKEAWYWMIDIVLGLVLIREKQSSLKHAYKWSVEGEGANETLPSNDSVLKRKVRKKKRQARSMRLCKIYILASYT